MGNGKQRQEGDEGREVWGGGRTNEKVSPRREKDEGNLRKRERCKGGDGEDTKSLFASLTASNGDSGGTNLCCPHPRRTSVDNMSLVNVSPHAHTSTNARTHAQTQTVK